MRVTQILRAQHLGHMFKKHWLAQGRRTPRDSGAKAILESRNVEVVDALDVVKVLPPRIDFTPAQVEHFLQRPVPLDESHPDWNDRKCYTMDDTNVLLEGVQQAQVLTKTLCVDRLPQKIEKLLDNSLISEASENRIRNAVLTANVFDAEQKKLAKRKDPNRPAFVFPRDYGITDARKTRLILSNLVSEIEKLAGRSTTSFRKIINDVQFCIPFEKDGDLISINIHADTFITSKKPIVLEEEINRDVPTELPDLFPIKFTVSMPSTNIYKTKNFYPLLNGTSFNHPHTILLHYSPLDVKNLFATPVTESQFKARSLLKSFAVAAASARSKYGLDVTELPQPTVVQCIQTDGRAFYFGCLELNTLNLSGTTGTKNYWYGGPTLNLFEECAYKSAKPVLVNYNRDVLKYFAAFYNNN